MISKFLETKFGEAILTAGLLILCVIWSGFCFWLGGAIVTLLLPIAVPLLLISFVFLTWIAYERLG